MGRGKASGRRSTPLTTLKMAVFAPMPSASVRMAIAVNPGLFDKQPEGVADVLQEQSAW